MRTKAFPPPVTHPLYMAYVRADAAWTAQIAEAARTIGAWPARYRDSPAAERLPAYPAFAAARDAWIRHECPIMLRVL